MKQNRIYRLGEIAGIVTGSRMKRDFSITNTEEHIFIPKTVRHENLCVEMVKGIAETDGFYVLLKEEYKSALRKDYVIYQLSSLAGGLKLLYDTEKQQYRSRILLNILKQYSICVIPIDLQFYYAISQNLVSYLHAVIETVSYVKEQEDFVASRQYMIEFFKEIRDALSLEQELQPLFNEYGITIFTHWKNIIDKTKGDKNNFEKNIFIEATKPKNELYNNIKKMRLLVSNIGKLITEKNQL